MATFTWVTVRVVPRSYWIQAPSPLPDQRVVRLLSTVLAGTLVSLVFAVTPAPPGVTSTGVPPGVGVVVGVAVGVAVGVGVGVDVGVGVGVAVGVGPLGAKMLTSVTLLKVEVVAPCPRYRTQRASTSAKSCV